MRLMWVFMMVVAAAVADDRMCPTGYVYTGDDTPEDELLPDPEPRDYVYEETARSPIYSCYRLEDTHHDTWLSAMNQCWAEDAQLASLEDPVEMSRVLGTYKTKVLAASAGGGAIQTSHALDVFTSGMLFSGVNQWYWVGSNRTLNEEYYTVENMADENQNSIADSPRDCLLFRMSVDSETADLSLVAESCFVKKPYLCEIRVQTVTYYSWFVANWVEMLLGFLLLIMFVSLIVTLCACTSRDSGRSSAARRRRHQQQQQQRTNAASIDLPPNYGEAVMVHTTVSSLEEKPTNGGSSSSRMDYYKTRGRELMGKVYLYKPKNSNPRPVP